MGDECWWLVSAQVNGTYITMQFATLASNEAEARAAVMGPVEYLNALRDVERLIVVGAAERLTDA